MNGASLLLALRQAPGEQSLKEFTLLNCLVPCNNFAIGPFLKKETSHRLELQFIKLMVEPLARQERGVVPLLGNGPLIDDDDLVRIADG